MKLYTSRSAVNMHFKGEVNTSPSMTIPNQEISPAMLLARYATGQPLGLKMVEAIYDSDVGHEIPEFNKMDQLERLHALQENSDELEYLKNAYADEVAKRESNKKKAKQSERKDEAASKAKEPSEAERSQATEQASSE